MHTTSGMTRALVVFAAGRFPPAQDSRFDVRSRLVVVPVSVTDLKGRSIDGLEASDFLLFDNGRAQKVTVDTIDTGVAPIALIVAVQASGISTAALEKVRRIGSMIQPVVTGERGCAGLVSFADRVNVASGMHEGCRLAGSRVLQTPARRPAAAISSTDACSTPWQSAVERLRRQPNARRVLLLISESRDRGSEAALDVVTVAAQSAGVTVYAATYSAFATAFTSKAAVTPPARHSRALPQAACRRSDEDEQRSSAGQIQSQNSSAGRAGGFSRRSARVSAPRNGEHDRGPGEEHGRRDLSRSPVKRRWRKRSRSSAPSCTRSTCSVSLRRGPRRAITRSKCASRGPANFGSAPGRDTGRPKKRHLRKSHMTSENTALRMRHVASGK